jgi:hypothetical protein
MSPVPSVRSVIDGLQRTLRREASLAVLFAALAVVPAALLLASVVGMLRPWRQPDAGPLLIDLLALGAVAALLVVGVRRWIAALDESAVAADVERSTGMAEGAVRGVLELGRAVPEGTSAALARQAEVELGARLRAMAPTRAAARLHLAVRRRRRTAAAAFGVLSTVAVFAAFTAPAHSRAAWTPLVHPVRNLTPPPLPPLRVLPGDTSVQRGTALAVRIAAAERQVVTLHWRTEGDVPQYEIGTVAGDSAVISIPAVHAPTQYWVRAPDGAASGRYRITPVDPLLLSELSVDVVYPPHVKRAPEHYAGDLPSLEVPEGTQILVAGRATRALRHAELRGAAGGTALTVDGDQFTGTLVPIASGLYAWSLRDSAGGALAVTPPPLEVILLRDAAPSVSITHPATDTVLDATLRQVIVADASDDFGLAGAVLVSWRVSSTGRTDAAHEQPIDVAADERALIRTLLDGSARDLTAGDTLKFFIRVTDNSPRRQTGVSATVALRLPGLTELRERAVDRADDLVDEAAQLTRAAAELQESTRDLVRRMGAANARRRADQQAGRSSGAAGARMDFQEAMPSRQMLERQEQMVAELESMRQGLDALEAAMERSGMRDGELQRRMAELRELLDELTSPEMKRQIEALRQALDELDPEAVEKALRQLEEQQAEMRKQLEHALEMMERAATEQEINSLAQEARELATQQDALAESMKAGQPGPEQTSTQRELAERAERLEEALAAIEERLRESGEESAAESTAAARENAAAAGERMQQAAQDAARQAGQQAGARGDEAAERLEQAADDLDAARRSLADSSKQKAQQSMQQATNDALSLAEQQQQLLERMQQLEQQAEQGQQQQGQQQPGQQQQGQQQQGQQQQGQQQGGQQQGRQPGQQAGQQQGGQQQGGQQGGQAQGGRQAGEQGGAGGDMQALRAEQAALQQGLQQLGRNLQEGGERSSAVNRETAAALARANLSMEQTLQAMQRGEGATQQAQQSLDALNRLALSLLNNAQQLQQSDNGSAAQQALQQLADMAKDQASVNGQSASLSQLDVAPAAAAPQVQRLASDQMDIARRLGSLNAGGREHMSGDIDALAREAEDLARQLHTGRLPPEVQARQERLFHRLLDAGRSLEKDEYENERTAERPSGVGRRDVDALDARLFEDPTRFRAPAPEQLQHLPPAYRRMILDYFERLNRPPPPGGGRP